MIQNMYLDCLGFMNTFDYAYREVQLKSPNWLYGQPKLVEDDLEKSDAKTRLAEVQATERKNEQEFGDLDWLASLSPHAEEELFTRYMFCPFADCLVHQSTKTAGD